MNRGTRRSLLLTVFALWLAALGLAADLSAQAAVPSVAPPAGVRAGVEVQVIERILQPVVENACRYARGLVRVGVTTDARGVALEVVDDGPGVEPADAEEIFEPGVRGPAADGCSGAGLGLPLARRLARAAGGEVEALAVPGGGRFVIRLPAA